MKIIEFLEKHYPEETEERRLAFLFAPNVMKKELVTKELENFDSEIINFQIAFYFIVNNEFNQEEKEEFRDEIVFLNSLDYSLENVLRKLP